MESDRLAHQVWLVDIALMLRVCVNCWACNLLEGLEEIGFITGGPVAHGHTRGDSRLCQKDPHHSDSLKDEVIQAASRYQAAHWQEVAAASGDSREGLLHGTHLRTHIAWVHLLQPHTVHDRDTACRILNMCLPRGVLRCLGWYRLGGHHLYGRLRGPAA